MDVPGLVIERLEDEEVTAGVSIGDQDAVCLTPTRTLVYRGDGILSDERVEEYPHGVEHLSVKEGRRKTKFVIGYVEGTETFTVPSSRGETVLELLLQGILRYEGIIGRRESIAGVYRFTELTLVVTDGRVLKHVGNYVWNDDFEEYPFEGVTGLGFERASNATSITIEVDGRPQRVKVPNDTAPLVRQTLENALFEHYGVDSLEALNAAVGTGGEPDADVDAGTDDIGLDPDIDPLVTTPDPDPDPDPDRDPDTGTDPDPNPDPVEERGEADGTAEAAGAADATGPRTEQDRSQDPDWDRESAVPDRMDVTPGPEEGESDESGEGPDSETAVDSPTDDQSANQSTARSASTSGPSGSDVEPRETGSEGRTDAPPTPGDDQGEVPSAVGGGSAEEGSDGSGDVDYEPAGEQDLAAVTAQVEELAEAVERQNELLKRQHKAIKQLVSELRSE